MKSAEDDRQRELLFALGRAVTATRGKDVDQMLEVYQKISGQFLTPALGDEFVEQETRRRIAEFILISSTENKYPFNVCRHFFDDLSRLGFEEADRRWRYDLIFSKYCLEAGHVDEGIALMKSLEVELAGDLRELYASLRQQTNRAMNETETSLVGKPSATRPSGHLSLFLEECNKLADRTSELDCHRIAEEYARLAQDFAVRAGADRAMGTEIAALASEQALYTAIIRKCDFELCKVLFESALKLGFATLERRIKAVLTYCEHADDTGRGEEGNAVLDELGSELAFEHGGAESDAEPPKIRSLQIYREYLALTRRRLDELRQAERGVDPSI